MLVLGRKSGESLVINGNIVVTVLSVGASGVRLGIEAPRDVRVVRKELVAAVTDENRQAQAHASAAALAAVAALLRRPPS